MEDWPKPRWGHPLPGWSKYLKPRAVIWLSLLTIYFIVGVTLSYIITEYQLEGTPRLFAPDNVDLPLSGEYFFQAVRVAEKDQDDVRVISIRLLRNRSTSFQVIYTPVLEFCSPKDIGWNYQIEVILARGLITGNEYIRTQSHKVIRDCAGKEISPPAIPSITAIEVAQRYVENNYKSIYDLWPYFLEAKRDEGRVLRWTIEFQSIDDKNRKLAIILNATTGEVLDVVE